MEYLKKISQITVLVATIIASTISPVSGLTNSNSNTPTASNSSTSNNSPGTGDALQIAPPLVYLTASPGQTIQTQIYLQNISKTKVVVNSTVNDFTAEGQTGIPKLFLSQSKPGPYSLKNYVVPIPLLILNPSQLEPITIHLEIPKNASPGGHFGVIRFTAQSPSLTGKSGVALSASLGALVLLTVSGHIINHLQLTQFDVTSNNKISNFFQSAPLTINEVLKNTGNEFEQPTGQLKIKDMFNHQIVLMDINRRQGNVLPATSRKFSQIINSNVIGNKRLFGEYTASINLSYGSSSAPVRATITFWVIPIEEIIFLILVLIFGFILIRVAIKRYNKYVIDQAKNKK